MADAEMTAPEAPPPTAPSLLDTIKENFNRLTSRQKLAGAAAIALSVALLVGVWAWNRQPAYSVLFSGLSEKDGGAIVALLQTQNVPYKVSDQTGAILVPAQMTGELRLRMASQGLPRGGNVGFELIDNDRLGSSQFHEQVNYQRALEGELGRTISSLTQVENARVHIAIPKQTAFLRDEQKPTASVVLTLYPGRTLGANQIAGIVHLVSSSVPQLSPEAVSILDQSGRLLTDKPDPLRMNDLDPTQLEYVHEVENRLRKRINDILEPIVGAGNIHAQVTADLDFDRQEQTAEIYRPNPSPDQAIRSQQLNESTTHQSGPGGVPGALSNQPPAPATAPITVPDANASGPANSMVLTSNKSSTTNFEVDKTIQHTKRSIGQVKRLSVAVVVNYRSETDPKGITKPVALSAEEMQQINNLVREAVGYSEQRGDTVNVANSPFAEVVKVSEDKPLWKDPEVQEMAKDGGRWLLYALLGLMIWLAVLRPLVRTVAPPPVKEEKSEPEEDAAEGEDGEDAVVTLSEDEDLSDDALLPPEVRIERLARMSFEKKLAKAREIAMNNPKVIATLLKEWMGANGNERR
ncbi:MAG: flagellar M-ring protein FliF [Betaproteobacteria bacterium]|nr:flagellar M-ring protein FliF [Betaproteobacteria bacterium]